MPLDSSGTVKTLRTVSVRWSQNRSGGNNSPNAQVFKSVEHGTADVLPRDNSLRYLKGSGVFFDHRFSILVRSFDEKDSRPRWLAAVPR